MNDSGDPFVLVGYFQHSKDRRTAGKSAWTDHYHAKVADFRCSRSHDAKEANREILFKYTALFVQSSQRPDKEFECLKSMHG